MSMGGGQTSVGVYVMEVWSIEDDSGHDIRPGNVCR